MPLLSQGNALEVLNAYKGQFDQEASRLQLQDGDEYMRALSSSVLLHNVILGVNPNASLNEGQAELFHEALAKVASDGFENGAVAALPLVTFVNSCNASR